MNFQFIHIDFVYPLVGLTLIALIGFSKAGTTSIYVRKNGLSEDMPLDSDVFQVPPGYNAPQQVHITQGDHRGRAVIVSWITPDEPGSNQVIYWDETSLIKRSAEAIVVQYNFYNYTSGYIHHASIEKLKYGTKYYYEVGLGDTKRQFWFFTPPKPGPDVRYTFGLIGDLGQTHDSNQTLTHYELNPMKGQTLLFVGDLSYADSYPFHDNKRWDTWGRFIERNAAYQPWIWTAGNHEIDFVPEHGETKPFKPYKHRFFVPYRSSASTSPLWYSINRASAYIIVMSSYSAYGKYTPQYEWLTSELQKVNRKVTPWLIVLVHCPIYSSYVHHFMEGETMRVLYEPWFVKYRVDVVFAGHVHAYERSERISNIAYDVVNGECTPTSDDSAPVYITIGDGGNQEGLVKKYRHLFLKFQNTLSLLSRKLEIIQMFPRRMTQPQPSYSAHREASFGHGIFDIKNRTHAYFGWHRNQDEYAVEADSVWLLNRYWKFVEETSVVVFLRMRTKLLKVFLEKTKYLDNNF